jgi:predicted nucleotidyltransferase
MSSTTRLLYKKGLIQIPKWMEANVHYEAITGSVAYGANLDDSDWDVTGFCIPPKETIFPHMAGHIPGFGTTPPGFDQMQRHGVEDKEAGRNYDLTMYSIIKFFQLCLQNNPNMIDVLFVPDRCLIHITPIGLMVRDGRHRFLHKGLWHRFKGYAYAQKKKMVSQTRTGKRQEGVEKHGYDLKFAMHLVRLLLEAEQMLTEGNLTLDRNSQQLLAIRRGEWSLKQIDHFFDTKEAQLEKVYHDCKILPYHQNDVEPGVKQLLLDCLEHHYGSISEAKRVGGKMR